jgi:hypothetical protein
MPSFPHPTEGQVLTRGKEPFEFTIYAGSKGAEWDRMLASNPWRCMELALRTADQVEARAFLTQARDFFGAADNAGPTSRPLLLYYGFLNLAKTLIKAKAPQIDLKRAFHGIRESPDNRAAQRFRLTSQSVEIQNARANSAHILNEFAEAIGWQRLVAGRNYFVCDLLSQIPAVRKIAPD